MQWIDGRTVMYASLAKPEERDGKPEALASAKQVGGDHYKKLAIQPIDYILQNGLGYCEGNVIKYVTRHKDKNGKQDLQKAIHYLQMLIEREYGEHD